MHRTTVMVPDELVQKLRHIASQRRTSIASIVREALEDKAASFRPKPTFLGIADSGCTDTSELASAGTPPPLTWR